MMNSNNEANSSFDSDIKGPELNNQKIAQDSFLQSFDQPNKFMLQKLYNLKVL